MSGENCLEECPGKCCWGLSGECPGKFVGDYLSNVQGNVVGGLSGERLGKCSWRII